MGGARYPKHPFLWFHVMLVMHVILPQCGSSMIKRYQAWEAWVCQQQEGNDQMGKLKKWKNGNDKNDHFIVSLSGATNLPAGKVGQADWVGSIGHLNDISDYFEKNMKQTIYTTTFLSIFLVVSTLSIPFLPIMVSPWRNFGCTTWSDPGQQSSLALIRQEMLAGMPRWLEGWLHLLTLVVGWCWLHMRSTVISSVSSD